MTNPPTECRRCGSCCKKGGPALHDEDRPLIDQEKIPLTALYTLRKGELAHDNIKDRLVPLEMEIIKIKSRQAASVCVYYNDGEMSCRIYPHRPIECQALKCWDIKEITAIYSQTRLTRMTLLKKIPWLTDMVQAHTSECGLEKIHHLVTARQAGDPEATRSLIQMINFDHHLRHLMSEKGKLPVELADLLFGRPIRQILSRQFDIKITMTQNS